MTSGSLGMSEDSKHFAAHTMIDRVIAGMERKAS